jgi:hypothetical protein
MSYWPEAATLPLRSRAELGRLLALAAEPGATADRVSRQPLARCYSQVEGMRPWDASRRARPASR